MKSALADSPQPLSTDAADVPPVAGEPSVSDRVEPHPESGKLRRSRRDTSSQQAASAETRVTSEVAASRLPAANSHESDREAGAAAARQRVPRPKQLARHRQSNRQPNRVRQAPPTRTRREPGLLPVVHVEADEKKLGRHWFRRSVGFISSTVLHAILIIALGLLTLSIPTLEIWSVDGRLTKAEPLPPEELEFEAATIDASASRAAEEVEASPETLTRWSMDSVLQTTGAASPANAMHGPVASVVAAAGLNREVDLRERGAQGTAEFFGIQARGYSFVYVVDCSDSMAGARLQRALYELRRSVENLAADQMFYVIMFDGHAHPMFSQEYPNLRMLPANDANRLRFNRWLRSVRVGDATRPKEALQLALYLEPDAIFLLSDGEFQDNSVVYLKENNPSVDVAEQGGEGVPIHTICFESRIGEPTLSSIAEDHQGTFRFIP